VLTGLVCDPQQRLLALLLVHIDFLDEQIAALTPMITRCWTDLRDRGPVTMPDATPRVPCSPGAPGTSATPLTFQRAVTLLDIMPGVNQRGAGLWVTERRP
jgi:hypothetical protein